MRLVVSQMMRLAARVCVALGMVAPVCGAVHSEVSAVGVIDGRVATTAARGRDWIDVRTCAQSSIQADDDFVLDTLTEQATILVFR